MKRPEPGGGRVAAAGALVAAALLAVAFHPRAVPAPAPAPAAVPPAPPAAATPAGEAATPPAPAPSAEGLKLHGVLGGGAIVALPGGAQRFVAIGRDVIPGLTLREVAQHQAVLRSAAGTTILTLDGRPAEGAAAAPAPAPQRAEARREETLRYRLGLAPRRAGGRIAGFALRPGADLPALRRAGLRPGDVLVSVNGMSFDSAEKVEELAAEIAGSYTAEFEFLRGGRRMRSSLEVNPRD